jgi:carboxymethylenebutenolidase
VTIAVLYVRDATHAAGEASALERLRAAGCAAWVCAALPDDDRRALAQLERELEHVARQPGVDVHGIAALGFGRAGTLALELGCTSRRVRAVIAVDPTLVYSALDAAHPIQPLELALNLDVPLLVCFSGRSPSADASTIELFERTMAQAMKHVELARFPDAAPGFCAPGSPSFRSVDAAELWRRALAFLHERLDGA